MTLPARPRDCGFTLLELLVVLAIGSALLAVVPPLLSGVGLTTELRGAARQLAAGMRAARNHAISRQQEAVLTVQLAERRFSVSGERRQGKLPSDEDVQIKLYTAQSEQIDDSTGQIRFFPDGSSTGGYVALHNERVEYRVNVDWLTGRIKIDQRDPE